MTTIVTRAGKGAPLLNSELDANFTNLNTDKAEKSGTDPIVISVNSSSDALRITQTGAGNALLVEDSANPDSTPFVITNNGSIIAGGLTGTYGVNFQSQNSYQETAFDSVLGSYLHLRRAANSLTSPSIVANGNLLGEIDFEGYDGSAYRTAASIQATVDGTPGTNDMPGRLVFSTTKDGASSPTEAMRIDNAGRVGIGGAPYAGNTLNIAKALTGAATAQQVNVGFTINSDVTSNASVFASYPATQAAAFTLTNLRHFSAAQGTIGAGSTVTYQYAFIADSSLTGATGNFGFYSNIASGTGRYNFFANGSADNYFAGAVGIGTIPTAGTYQLIVAGTMTASTAVSSYLGATASSTVSSLFGARTNLYTAASAFTLGSVSHFYADGVTVGSGSTVTAQYGFTAPSSLTGATNNYGFYSNIASGTGRWNFYAAGTADNYFAGAVGIGGTPQSDTKLHIYGTLPSSSNNSKANFAQFTVPNTTTNQAVGFLTYPSTQASSFTLGQIMHFYANQGAIGAGSTVNNQYGFFVESTLTGATNNYGFYSNIASGTGRYNFYAAGQAENYFASSVGIGAIASGIPGTQLLITGNATGSVNSRFVYSNPTFQSDVTNAARGFQTALATAAASFTIANMPHFQAQQSTFGAGSTVSNQFGFEVHSSLVGATNNYGFYSNIASGTGRYNFYAAGTADNYFAGKVGVGTTVTDGTLEISASSNSTPLVFGNAGGTQAFLVFRNSSTTVNNTRIGAETNDLTLYTSSSERMRIDSSGNVLVTGSGGLGYGTGSGGAVTQATSRTTGVTLNKTNGAITLVSAAGSATYQTFTVTNSTVAATDVIHVSQKSGTDKYIILVTAVAAGSFAITFATTGGTTTEQPVFNFAVLKAVAA